MSSNRIGLASSTPDMVEFDSTDRCDRCNAQAYALSEKSGLSLMWCVHHKNKYKKSLLDSGWKIHEAKRAIAALA